MQVDHTELIAKELQNIRRGIEQLVSLQRLALLGEDRILEFLYNDIAVRMWLPHAAHDYIQKQVLASGRFFEWRLLDKVSEMVGPVRLALDIGANIGNHILYMKKVWGVQRVVGFEPQSQIFPVLRRNLSLNELDDVAIHNCALGREKTRARIAAYRIDNLGATRLEDDWDGQFEVRTLDSMYIADVDFIKIDVEGRQLGVLHGGRDTIETCRPTVMCEIQRGSPDEQESFAFFDSLGYQRIALDEHNYFFKPGPHPHYRVPQFPG